MLRIFYIVSIFLYVNLFCVEDVIILGGGVSGISSAIYLARAGYRPIVIEGKVPGGVLIQSQLIQNWPSEEEISGEELMQKMKAQAITCGVLFASEQVVSVDFEKKPFRIVTEHLRDKKRKRYLSKACIIAMGAVPNRLHIPGETTYWGKGLSNCAVCDGFLYKGKTVAVIGGGDHAILEAEYLSKLAEKVYVFVRKGTFKTVESDRLAKLFNQKNVEIFFHSEVQEIMGTEETIESIRVVSQKQTRNFYVDGVFLAIGALPNTSVFQDQLQLDSKGYVLLEQDQQTSIKGVFAAGDIVDPVYKQAISASGDGAKAALQAKEFLEVIEAAQRSYKEPLQTLPK